MEITSYTLWPLISTVLFGVLAIAVYSSDARKETRISFAMLCLATVWWQFSWFVIFNTESEAIAQVIARLGYSGIILLPISFYIFFIFFFKEYDRQKKYLALFIFFGLSLLMLLWFSDLIVNGVYKYSWGFYPMAGDYFWTYLLMIAVLTIKTFRIIFREMKFSKKNHNLSKYRQAEFLFLGTIVYLFASIDFLANYGYDMYPIGFLFVLFFLGIITYSIVRDSLMNVKIFMTKLVALFIGSVVFLDIFFARSVQELILSIGYFGTIVFFATAIVHSVKKEVQQKEKLLNLSNELKRANVELKRLDKAKSEFISIASHQLRTPLTAIKGYISLVLEGAYGNNVEKTNDALNKVFLANERLIQLVEDLLNITRIESGRLELHLDEKVQVEEIVEELKDMFVLRAEDKKLDFVVELPTEKLPCIKADPSKLREVISNLIDNAIKYTKVGFVHVSMESDDSVARVIVEDSGVGISEESMKTLFTKFSRGTDSSKIYTEGTGLGLYVGKNLIESQGGRIYVESDGVGRGSRFIVEMPIEK